MNRAAVLGETCTAGAPGCVPLFLTTGVANDWLHGNSLYHAADGSILLSMRHQDWIDKIDYNNGAGTGNVLWTLGLGGDFTINSTDPYPWFSHQHDVGLRVRWVRRSCRCKTTAIRGLHRRPWVSGSGHSRGYVLSIDQTNMTATPSFAGDMGVYALAFGSAQRLSNGDYHFDEGFLQNPGPYNQSIEVSPTSVQGTLGFTFQLTGNFAYRSFRMADLYTLPQKFATE